MTKKPDNSNGGEKLGTFSGVFVPSVLGILGLILFLRLDWVVGKAGPVYALLIITISTLLAAITTLSLSAIATNMPIRTGGIYYMISRSLGLRIGGAIGIPLYLSQAMSVAFFSIGFAEAFAVVIPDLDQRIIATMVVIIFTLLAYIGADFALKFKFVALIFVGLAIGSIFLGGSPERGSGALFHVGGRPDDFWMVFAVFFPAMKGIAVGVSMSGDLKDPGESIPKGAFGAIGVSFLIYCAVALWLAASADPQSLVSDGSILQSISRWPELVFLGVWGGALASALGNTLAAPRTLQALAKDRIAPASFESGMGSPTEPRAAILATMVIAVAVIWMGDLNFVAKLISMFFLNTFAMLNLTAGLELLVGNPSFRPRIKAPSIIPILGAVGCYSAMALINLTATVVAIVVSYGIFLLLERRAVKQKWGDLTQGIWLELAQFMLTRIESFPSGVKNWRPNIVVFSGFTSKYQNLLQMGDWLSKGRGMVTFYHLIIGDLTGLSSRTIRHSSQRRLLRNMKELECDCFVESSIVKDFNDGVLQAIQAHGIAGLEPNTAMMALETSPEKLRDQISLIDNITGLGKSVALVHGGEDGGFGERKQIDVWWTDAQREREMMLMLAHILRRSADWKAAKIKVLRVVNKESAVIEASKELDKWIRDARVEAQSRIMIRSNPDELFSKEFREESASADLVIMALTFGDEEDPEARVAYLTDLFQAVRTPMLLVKSGEERDILSGEEKEHMIPIS
jgi:amino acid transporter